MIVVRTMFIQYKYNHYGYNNINMCADKAQYNITKIIIVYLSSVVYVFFKCFCRHYCADSIHTYIYT